MPSPARIAFAVFFLGNLVWLGVRVKAREPDVPVANAYAACRAAVRRLRPEAARIPFPSADLIRVSRSRSGRITVRGYYIASNSGHHTGYACELEQAPGADRLVVDSIVVQP